MKVNSELIRELRQQHTISQEMLAEAADLSPRTVQRIESTSTASLESTMAIAAVFEIEAGALEDTRLEQGRIVQGMQRGLRFGMAGIVLGALLASLGIATDFFTGGATAKQAGITLGLVGAAAGLCSAALSLIMNRQIKSLAEQRRAPLQPRKDLNE